MAGDIILNKDISDQDAFFSDLLDNFNPKKVFNTGGFFYCIRINYQQRKIEIYNSFLGILPLYYLEYNDTLYVSSSSIQIKKYLNKEIKISRQFILEKLLFNYPFRNQSLYEGIKSIPSNSYIKYDGKFSIIKHTDISDWFIEDPKPWKKALPSLKDLLLIEYKNYFPDEMFYLSFTGGFDGRTLLSVILNNDKDFKTFSFGIKESDDVIIPLNQSELLGINHNPLYLDDKEYIKSYLKYGFELVNGSDGVANFARAHYVYAADKISEKSNYIINGNFGSELFRAFHNTGVMVSDTLFNLLTINDTKQALNEIEKSKVFNLIPKEKYKHAWEEIKNDLVNDDLFNQKIALNKRFYGYIFEEIFRKYFGAEIKMQFSRLISRSPYLDVHFFKELLKTNLSGVYSKFYEQNPVKRFKGQVFYAEIIKQFSDEMLRLKTGKGYSPKDLISMSGKGYLVKNYLKKKIIRSSKDQDDFGVEECFRSNENFLFEIPVNGDYFLDISTLDISDLDLNDKINFHSLNYLINNLKNEGI